MSGTKKLLLLGTVWSVLVVVLLLLLEPEKFSLPVVLALTFMFVGWVCAAIFCRDSGQPTSAQATATQVSQKIIAHSSDAIVRLSSGLSIQICEMREEISRAQAIFGEAIDRLISSFQQMSVQVQRQQQLGLQVVGGGSEDGVVDDFHAFAIEISNTLRQFIESVVENSHLAMTLGEMSDRISTQTSEVRDMLGEIEGVAKQTNLLVLNTAIEAAQTNTAGQDFALVADEVRDLSERTNHFSKQIRGSLSNMQVTIAATEQAIIQAADKEMMFALTLKANVEQAMNDIEAMGRRTGDTVGELSGIAMQVESAVSEAIVSLQFQDMLTQLLGHVSRRLDVLDEAIGDEQRLAAVLRDTSDPASTLRALGAIREHVDLLAEKMSTLQQRVSKNPVSQSGFASGGIELF